MTAKATNSVAVLPFLNMSSDLENEYFSDGITEEIINALTRIEGLQVTARTSSFAFKGKNADIRRIGRELGVETVLEGSVRKAGNRVRITAQLINVADGYHFWSETYDRHLEDIFAIQDEISLKIAEKLREHFGHFHIQERLINRSTHNVAAYQLYLKGKFFANKWTADDFGTAIRIFEESIDLEPGFALPYAGMADVFTAMAALSIMDSNLAFGKAREFALKALEINDTLAESHIALANILFWYNWEFDKAYYELHKALKLAPGNAEAQGLLGLYKALGGDLDAGEQQLREALQADPYSLQLHFGMCAIQQIRSNYDLVIKEADIVLHLNPQFQRARDVKAGALYMQEKYQEAINLLERSMQLPGGDQANLGWIACCYQKMGQPEKAAEYHEKTFQFFQKNPQHTCTVYSLAAYAMNNRDLKQVMDYLEEGIRLRITDLIFLPFDPVFKPLADHPRFCKLLKHIKQKHYSAEPQASKTRYARSKLKEADAHYINERLLAYMEDTQPYLDHQLCLRQLAEMLDVNANYLSQVINERHGRNFFEFVNHYRVNALKEKLEDPSNRQFTILSLAFECGFNSKTTFNTAFKRLTGQTPSQYLREVQPQ